MRHSSYTILEKTVALHQARSHFLRRTGVQPMVAAIVAKDPKSDAWKLMREANGAPHVDHVVGKLTARYLRWNRGSTPNEPAYLRR